MDRDAQPRGLEPQGEQGGPRIAIERSDDHEERGGRFDELRLFLASAEASGAAAYTAVAARHSAGRVSAAIASVSVAESARHSVDSPSTGPRIPSGSKRSQRVSSAVDRPSSQLSRAAAWNQLVYDARSGCDATTRRNPRDVAKRSRAESSSAGNGRGE